MAALKPPPPVTRAEHQRRRKALLGLAQDDAILILPAAPERIRSHDTHHPYRQDSDFAYLTGFPEPEAVLVLVPGRAHGEALLFCRERHPERELWDGPRAGPEGAVADYGLDDAYAIDDIDEHLLAIDVDDGGTRRDLQALLQELPSVQQQAIVLTKLEGLSVAEAASRTGASESAIKVQVHRGLKRLAALVRQDPSP